MSQSRAEGKERRDRKEEKRLAQMQVDTGEGKETNGRCKDQNGSARYAERSILESQASDETEDEMIL